MKQILNNYCNKENGLLLFDPPTGSGKTYNVLSWIYNNYKDFCKENRKIFFVTNLKKNLPDQKLKNDFFIPNKELEDFEKYVTFLDSNADCLVKRFEQVESSINDYFKNSKIFYSIKSNVYEINKHQSKSDLKTYVTKLNEELRNDLEPKFRRSIEKFLKENYPNKQERIKAIQTDKNLKWIGELYPAVFSSKKKIFFLSIDKFYHKNSTLVEPSYSFLENDITKNAIIFIDEFDATKDNILNNIIEKGKKQRIDFIHLFTEIYWALSKNVLPQKFITHSEKREELIEKKYGLALDDIQKTLLEKAEEIVQKYHLDFSFKTTNNNDDNVNQRNLLFHDFQYHSVYRNDKKFIRLNPNKFDKINEIIFESERPQTGENIVSLLNQIKGFINYFSGVIKSIAENYQQLEEQERKSNPRRTEFTFDLAISTVIEEFGLETKHKNYLIDNILSARERPRSKKDGSYELNYDLSIYENGFRYYDFVDDDSHQSKTKAFIYNFQNTPEKFILKLAEKAKVIGISATALIETVTGNYDIKYFKRQLGNKFIELTKKEKQQLKDTFNKQNKHYDKVKINTEWVNFTNSNEVEKINIEFEKLFENKELANDVIGDLKAINPNSTDYHFNRYLKIGYCFKQFLLKEDIKGFLCLLNKEPKWNDKGLNLKALHKIFEYLIEDTTKTQNLFLNDKDEFEIKNSYTIINSNDFDNKKQSFITQLESGKKVFIISMYQTMGAGQNLQFISPNPDKLINVKDENSENWNIQNETDINAIYLDKPTHIIQKIDLNLNEEGFIKYLFQLEFLAQVGLISIKQLNHQVTIAFKHLLASFNTTIKPESPNNGFLYKDFNIKQHFAKYIIQAIGRICRTNLKSPNIYIYADSELDNLICDFDVDNNLVLNEFKELVKSSREKIQQENDKDSKLKNIANVTNRKVHAKIRKFISPDWSWKEKQKEEWENLREMCLRFPTISENEIDKFNLNRILDLYIELPKENDKYYFSLYNDEEYNDYQNVEIDFDKSIGSEVSSSSVRLNKLLKISGVEAFFKTKNWATDFTLNKYILPPVLFNNIYKGALGEQIGKFIFEKHLKIELEELPLENYELFDYKIKDLNTYIDFKHWKENTQISFEEQERKIREKLKSVNGEKVFIINILSSENKIPIKSSDGKIIEIPCLWNTEKQELDFSFLEIFKENEALQNQ
jgi:hypothetical protein